MNKLTLSLSINNDLALVTTLTILIQPVSSGIISLCGKADGIGGIIDGFTGDIMNFLYFSGVGALSNQANGMFKLVCI